jgi:hypothetical protein
MAGPLPQAGWYPDPIEAGWVRWWDGRVWTSHRQLDPMAVDDLDEDERFLFETDDDVDPEVGLLHDEPDDDLPAEFDVDVADDDVADDELPVDEGPDAEAEDDRAADAAWAGHAERPDPADDSARQAALADRQRRGTVIATGLIATGLVILLVALFMSRSGDDGARAVAEAPEGIAAPAPDWVTYADPSGWSLAHPPGWTTTPQQIALFVFIDAEGVAFRRNINVQREAVAAGMTVERLAEQNRNTIAGAGTNVRILAEDDGTMGGEPAHRFVIEGDLDGGRVRLLSVVAIVRSTAYIVTYTADAPRFDEALPDVERVLAAMKLTS